MNINILLYLATSYKVQETSQVFKMSSVGISTFYPNKMGLCVKKVIEK